MSAGGNVALALEHLAEARGWLDRPLFHAGPTTTTHGEAHDFAARVGTVLGDAGAGAGDRVLIAASDSVEFAAAFLGALRIGAVAVTVNPSLTATDHERLVGDAGPTVVVADAAIADRFPGAAAVLVAEGLGATAATAARAPGRPVADDALAYVQYTSGTTGTPKGAVHRHCDPFVYFDAVAGGVYGLTEDDVILCVSKMFFAYGLPTSVLHPMLAGASAVLIRERPTPELVGDLSARHGVTILLTVPTFIASLLDTGRSDAFTTTRLVVSGGEPLVETLRVDASAFFGCPILNHLGSTEVGHGYVGDLPDDHRAGTAGRAVPPYVVEVRDEHGAPVDAGVEGLVWVSGPTLLAEYLNKPDATAAALVDGWFRSGDRGVLDADGYLTLAGRADDVEIVAGHKVWPAEIEAAIARHPAVHSVAVVGDAGERGSVLRALVVPRPGTPADQSVVDEIVDTARDQLAPFKVPRLFTFVDELPRTPTGKLQRFRLRQEVATFVADDRTFRRRQDWAHASEQETQR